MISSRNKKAAHEGGWNDSGPPVWTALAWRETKQLTQQTHKQWSNVYV